MKNILTDIKESDLADLQNKYKGKIEIVDCKDCDELSELGSIELCDKCEKLCSKKQK